MKATSAIFSLLSTALLLTSECLIANTTVLASDAIPGTEEATKVASDWWHQACVPSGRQSGGVPVWVGLPAEKRTQS